MFKCKKKKTGCETPTFRKPVPMPPTKPVTENFKPKSIAKGYIGVKEQFERHAEQFDDLLKIDNAEIYWSDKKESIIVVASPEWRDYLTGKRATPIVEREN